MKKLFTLLVTCFALLIGISAQAQNPKYSASGPIVYTSTAAGVSNYIGTGPVFIDCSKQRNVGISIVSVAAGAATDTNAFTFTPTIDGTTNTMMTNLSVVFRQALNGTTLVSGGTNLDSLGYKGFLVTAYTNNYAGNSTNTIYYGTKISTP